MGLLWVLLGYCPARAQSTSTLVGATSGNFRWKDVAGNAYSTNYQTGYSYTQAHVVVTYTTNATILSGMLAASNLKPNFAYQFKLSGEPETDPTGNENLGFSGRWWQESWNGSAWADGMNLNVKGDGSSPNSNDVTYLSRRDVTNATSPTCKQYRYTGYRPFDYFVTDSNGNASVHFSVTSAYHVLWKTSQRGPEADDGRIVSHAFDPDPSSQPAYGTDYPGTNVSIFGEWERLPMGKVYLAPGEYTLGFQLTEESFHGVDGDLSGVWAHAVYGTARFTIVRPTLDASVEPGHGGSTAPSGTVEVECGSSSNVTIAVNE